MCSEGSVIVCARICFVYLFLFVRLFYLVVVFEMLL